MLECWQSSLILLQWIGIFRWWFWWCCFSQFKTSTVLSTKLRQLSWSPSSSLFSNEHATKYPQSCIFPQEDQLQSSSLHILQDQVLLNRTALRTCAAVGINPLAWAPPNRPVNRLSLLQIKADTTVTRPRRGNWPKSPSTPSSILRISLSSWTQQPTTAVGPAWSYYLTTILMGYTPTLSLFCVGML